VFSLLANCKNISSKELMRKDWCKAFMLRNPILLLLKFRKNNTQLEYYIVRANEEESEY